MSTGIHQAGSGQNRASLSSPERLRGRPCDVRRRTAPYDHEPGYSQASGLWLYGNVRLLQSDRAYVADAIGPPIHTPSQLDDIEQQAELLVLSGKVLVCGVHSPAHMRSAIVPLRWGSPRIVVFSGGFHSHLGDDLMEEPFRSARLWRREWDARIDLAISRRAPSKLPTYSRHNSTVDRTISMIARGQWEGINAPTDLLGPALASRA